jgi:pimeloyl-ACP methyl ester carboxylesterase
MGFPSQPPPLNGVVHIDVRVDRARWHVATAGDPEAPPLVLLHGWPQHWWMWRRIIGPLARDFRVYAPDLRGFGWSDAPAGTYSKMGLASDVEKLLDELEIEKAVVAGHDWGGFVAWLLAIRSPERLERLVALDIIHPWWRPERGLRAALSGTYQLPLIAPVLGPLSMRFAPRVIPRLDDPGWSAEDVRLYSGQYTRPAHAAAATAIYRTFVTRELPALATGKYDNRRVDVPVRYATGRRDAVIPPARLQGAERFVADLRTDVIEDAGHFTPEQRPQQVVEIIRGT